MEFGNGGVSMKEKIEEILRKELEQWGLKECLDTVKVIYIEDEEDPVYFEAVALYSFIILDHGMHLEIEIIGKYFKDSEEINIENISPIIVLE